MILPIIKNPHPILRIRCKEVEVPNDLFWDFVEDMKETALHNQLVGLAANQVNADARFFIMDMNATDDENTLPVDFQVFINPVVSPAGSSKVEYGIEGCGSLPGIVGKVSRYTDVVVDYWVDGKTKKETVLHGYLARIAQHEEDHLNGLLITDRTSMIREAK